MSAEAKHYIGLMSGTSIDGIDAALIAIENGIIKIIETYNHDIPSALHSQLTALCQPGPNEIERLGKADFLLGEQFALASNLLLQHSKLNATDIVAIGSHGQTIRHRPTGDTPFTLQIGNPALICQQTGITTVADFRRRDMACGGQGAPLAPAFHQAAFGAVDKNRVIVNIGGIANITPLIAGKAQQGFDTGPGNGLMDYWVNDQRAKRYDDNGAWAASGQPIKELLAALLRDPYFSYAAPKSTGREYFNSNWLAQFIKDEYNQAEDIQATLLELTAKTISDEILKLHAPINEVYICGGGAYNRHLMDRLQKLLTNIPISDTHQLGIAPEWVEAAAFAWLAHQTLSGLPGNIPAATGAAQACILGAIYPA